MHAIMEWDDHCLERLHGIVAYLKQTQHDVHFLNSNWVGLSDIEEWNGDNDHDGKQKQRDIVKRRVKVVQLMVVIFLNEKIIVLLDQ